MPPPTVYQELPADTFDYDTDWVEAVSESQPGGGGYASAGEQEEVQVGYIPFNKVRSARRFFLGYAYSELGVYRLRRELPARHPVVPTLLAYSFSALGVGPKSNPLNPTRATYQLSPFAPYDLKQLRYADYEKALVTVRYKSFGRMAFLEDAQVDGDSPTTAYKNEWRRFTTTVARPQTQALSADGSSQLRFREGATNTQPVRDVSAFPAPLAELMAKTNLSVKWSMVPHDYLSDSSFVLKPTKVLERLGCVNADACFDEGSAGARYEKGTLLFLAAEFDSILFPVVSTDLTNPATGWDVTFHFEYFDPEKGYDSEYRGHRLFPWRVDGRWYYATREDSAREMLPLKNMMPMFAHVRSAAS